MGRAVWQVVTNWDPEIFPLINIIELPFRPGPLVNCQIFIDEAGSNDQQNGLLVSTLVS